jgi:hypothetical protein
MPEPDRNGIAARLRRLPFQLLLALVNATALLAIAAAVLVLVATVRIEQFVGNVAGTMTEAVLSKVDLPSKNVLANLQKLSAEVHALRSTLGEIKSGEQPLLRSEIERLKDAAVTLNANIDRLASARSAFTEEAIMRLGQAITGVLMRWRSCAPDAGRTAPRSSRHESGPV